MECKRKYLLFPPPRLGRREGGVTRTLVVRPLKNTDILVCLPVIVRRYFFLDFHYGSLLSRKCAATYSFVYKIISRWVFARALGKPQNMLLSFFFGFPKGFSNMCGTLSLYYAKSFIAYLRFFYRVYTKLEEEENIMALKNTLKKNKKNKKKHICATNIP